MMIMQQAINSIEERRKKSGRRQPRPNRNQKRNPPQPLDLILDISAIETYPSFRPGWAYSLSVERIVRKVPLSSCVYRIFPAVCG
jgi:hypothetical protein